MRSKKRYFITSAAAAADKNENEAKKEPRSMEGGEEKTQYLLF